MLHVTRCIHSKANNIDIEGLYMRIRLFMYKTAQPFSLIEDETFRNLFDTKLFSQEKLRAYMENDFANLTNEIQLNIDKASTAILVLDEWTHFNNSFLGITAYFTGKDVKYDSIVLALSVPSAFDRTSNTIAQELTNQLANYNIMSKVKGAITDCASVMRKTFNILNITWAP